MEQIVSPWFIYLLGVIDGIQVLLVVGIIISAVVAVISGIVTATMRFDCDFEDHEFKKPRAIFRKSIPWLIIFSVFGTFMPTKKTVIGMYVADHVTVNNLEKLVEGGKVAKDELKKDILELIEAMTREKTKEE